MLYTSCMRLLGIDYGTKKIGLALSDENGRFAAPLLVIPAGDQALSTVAEICQKEGVGQIVIGKSLDYKGEENPVYFEAERFGKLLEQATGIPIFYELEILTTKEAERDIGKDALTDARAAALILKSYIDQQKNNGNR
ncbi:MAG: putative pre6S rRNA nuclease [Patescibacteria group bacterium]|nr:putative pre6S rRNA nuclease [Patescibacteria group bacterium]